VSLASKILYKPFFQMVASLTSYDPKMGSQMHPQNQLNDVCCHLANMIAKAGVCYGGCHEPSDVTFCQITLALVIIL